MMTKVFKGAYVRKTKCKNGWYLKLKDCPTLEGTTRLRAVDNNGEEIIGGAILDISGTEGVRLHRGLTGGIGLPLADNQKIKQFTY